MKKLIFILIVNSCVLFAQNNYPKYIWLRDFQYNNQDESYLHSTNEDSLLVGIDLDYFYVINSYTGSVYSSIKVKDAVSKMDMSFLSIRKDKIALITPFSFIKIYNYKTGDSMTQFFSDFFSISCFSEDGSRFIVINEKARKFYDTQSGNLIKYDTLNFSYEDNITLSPKGNIFSYINKNSIEFWSVDSLKLLFKYELINKIGGNPSISDNEEKFLYIDNQSRIQIIDIKTGVNNHNFDSVNLKDICYCWSKNFDYLAIISEDNSTFSFKIYYYNGLTEIKSDIENYSGISNLSPQIYYLSNDADKIVFNYADIYDCSPKIEMPSFKNKIALYDLEKNSGLLEFDDMFSHCIFSNDGTKLLASTKNYISCFINISDGKIYDGLQFEKKLISFAQDTNFLVLSDTNVLYFYYINKRIITDSLVIPGKDIKQILYSPNGDKLAVNDDKNVFVYEMPSGMFINKFTPDSNNLSFRYSGYYKFSNDGKKLNVLTEQKEYFSYDIPTGNILFKKSFINKPHTIQDLSKNGDYILLLQEDTVSVYDVNLDTMIFKKVLKHVWEGRTVHFLYTHKQILVWDMDNPMDYNEYNYIINFEPDENTTERCDFEVNNQGLVFPSPDGQHFAFTECPNGLGFAEYCDGFKTKINDTYHFMVPPNFSIFPNPTSGNITLSFFLTQAGLVNFKIFNSIGIEFSDLAVSRFYESGQNNIQFITQKLPSGIYFCQISYGSQKYIEKLIILR